MRHIVCAALRLDGRIIIGPRHYDETMRKQIIELPEGRRDWLNAEQGFIDSAGSFLTREEAWVVATTLNQIRRELPVSGRLFSEHLY